MPGNSGIDPFVGEIRLMSFSFAPSGWAMCNGQLLPINQNQPLFALLGTTFGGNGQTTFALPDYRGRVPVSVGNALTLGQKGGEEAHVLSVAELPVHVHAMQGTTSNADTPVPTGNLFGANSNQYGAPANLTTLNPATLANTGGSQAHQNMQPFLALNFCIALQGIFPSPN